MGAFFSRYRLLTAAFVALLAFMIVFHAWSKWIKAAPLDAPINLSHAGRVEADVHIRLACPHRLGLYLTSKTRTREEMRRLVGRYGTTEGIAIPLRWTFRDATGRVAASGEALNEGSDGYDTEGFYRSVSGGLSLPPGQYQLEVTLAGEVTGLEGVVATVYFRCHPKSSAV